MPAVGGAVTSRGVVWLDDLPGGSPAEKLRAAWGAGDRRAVIVSHSTTIDAGPQPIPVPAGVCLAGPAGPQTEFSDQGRVFVRATGGTAVFRSMDSGSNYAGTKGWSFVNLGFEGTSGLNLFAPNPMNASGPIMAYASIEGCSFDTFKTIIESPLLGCHWDIRYFNNISGQYAFKLGGSDNQLWTHGGKGDWGGTNSVPGRQALVWLSSLEKTTIGAGAISGGGLYLTCQGSAGLQVDGGADRDGVDVFGATIEGRHPAQPSANAVVRITGGGINFFGGNINFGMGSPSGTDKAFVDVTGGRLGMYLTTFRRGNSTAPLVARRGAGQVNLIGCTESPSKQPVNVTNL